MEIIPMEDAQIVLFPQRFDTNTAPGVEADLRKLLLTTPQKIIFDFSKTEYVSSAGLRVLLLITRDQMKAGRKVMLVEIRPAVLRIFEMAGFTSIFPISRTRADALLKMA
ncbi:STAS domain-containing protein [uncultured Methanoregula sp.]|uniref:STAS domain-containing protein n=1 Tax=uncultured Methanoregula sp. TaxID=1005933 RepID=UPI002AAA8E7B|nr:STAS domain-containing protein [uncultured Methanoregula sp.]